jgi:hypothetical protein
VLCTYIILGGKRNIVIIINWESEQKSGRHRPKAFSANDEEGSFQHGSELPLGLA